MLLPRLGGVEANRTVVLLHRHQWQTCRRAFVGHLIACSTALSSTPPRAIQPLLSVRPIQPHPHNTQPITHTCTTHTSSPFFHPSRGQRAKTLKITLHNNSLLHQRAAVLPASARRSALYESCRQFLRLLISAAAAAAACMFWYFR